MYKLFLFLIFLSMFSSSISDYRKTKKNPISPKRKEVQEKIVQSHNHFRSRVVPKASNMLKMSWHKQAAKLAQNWAKKCVYLQHDDGAQRQVKNLGGCGQNIFISTAKTSWRSAIESWYSEKDKFRYGNSTNNYKVIGHYTQMVWATSHKIGCGFAKCRFKDSNRKFYNYVCNYCPAGNIKNQLGNPYKAGQPCGMCKHHCFAKTLCTNSCPFVNFYSNCKDMFKSHPQQLCHDRGIKGRELFQRCKATCTCKNKIFD